ncbi:phage recombination protein Bet [Lamprobacter modestohalophilus]|uniref:phage recombination protein Bet n=1 Tax=Lamprobacter modestohalophilus TaxID=1064514 RepID=UPI002ADEA7E2|nr:phage recombination protein Bet [Lamprobacter modestohalophilus]MEA1049094.1 phage recombination protein Bet [Lamprobacter modestohalophilus]
MSARLPISTPALESLGLDESTWRVLTDSIFPSAKTADGIALAVRYCQARGLDVLKRPVHVVPMWSRAQGREIETVWPGINEVQVTAARTGQYAGLDSPRFGPEVKRWFSGRAKVSDGWQDVSVEVNFPEWCEVTVYRLVAGQRCAFTETVFWEETYSKAGGASTEVPTAMWIRRPRGQLLKCAKAAALRAAFPEEGTYVAEEMEGKSIEPEELPVAEATPAVPAAKTEAKADPPLDARFQAKVTQLIHRAERAGAWQQAEDYLRERFTGKALAYALDQLEQADTAVIDEAA